MQLRHGIALLLVFTTIGTQAQLSPLITNWVINPGGETGYGGIPSNVLAVSYNDNFVYVNCNSMPGYAIGPWPTDPWQPDAMGFLFRLTLQPQPNNGTLITTPYGHIGLWTNGVSVYNPKDTHSWNELGVWFQNAFFFENNTFDDCLGHPNQLNEYHLHVNPTCLYDDTDSTQHSPIIGWAFDGFPIYGAFAHANTDGTGPITRMRSPWHLRDITARTVLPDGTLLTPDQYGPPLDLYPLGAYIEDHEYSAGSGTLDDHNGRFCITPEYPDGTYAYFVTLDADLQPAFPYVLGTTYYGTVPPGNTGPNGGYNEIIGPVTVYNPSVGVAEAASAAAVVLYPNPVADRLTIAGLSGGTWHIDLYNAWGAQALSTAHANEGPAVLDVSTLAPGTYAVVLSNGSTQHALRVNVQR